MPAIAAVLCDYCGQSAELVSGRVIYPDLPQLHNRQFWRCVMCAAYVGCHKKTNQPLGRLANHELRRWKQAAHTSFDRLWRYEGMTRSEAYAWLSKQLGLTTEATHIGQFDIEMCGRVIEVVKLK